MKTPTTTTECAAIFGVRDPGSITEALAARCSKEGLHVYIESDSTRPGALFSRIDSEGRHPVLVVLVTPGVSRPPSPLSALDTPVADIESQWRIICFAGCIIGQEAIRRMRIARQGTLLFLGHTASLRTDAGSTAVASAAFASAGAGLRSFAQSMAREFGPKGIHVAHIVLDDAAGEPNPNAVAETCWQLHRQHRTAWTQELDLRASK